MNKKCISCNLIKNITDFHKYKRSRDGVRSTCKSCRSIKYESNSQHYRKKARENYVKNSDRIKKYQKEYKKKNKSLINEREREYKKNKRANDEIFLIKENISCLIRNSLNLYSHKKESKTKDILGIDINQFKDYLNNNPYGFEYKDKEMDLDHIVPISKAKSKDDAVLLNHYTNFQLLPKKYNRNIKKDNEFNREHFEDWLTKNPFF